MSIYVVSDVHNNWTRFNQLVELLEFTSLDTLVINGDLIDRGTGAKSLIQFLKTYKVQIIYILGNHEQMFIDAYETGKLFNADIKFEEVSYRKKLFKLAIHKDEVCNLWFSNGGYETFKELSIEEIHWLYNYYKNECTYYKFIENNLFVHAGITIDNKNYTLKELENILEKEDTYNLVWNRRFFEKFCVFKSINRLKLPCNIFVGHTSMVGNNLVYRIVCETPLENGYKIVATDMSDNTLDDTSMMIYCVDLNIAYIARKGYISEQKYDNTLGYYQLMEKAQIGRYAYLTRADKKFLNQYNMKHTEITEEEYYNRFLIGGEDLMEFL